MSVSDRGASWANSSRAGGFLDSRFKRLGLDPAGDGTDFGKTQDLTAESPDSGSRPAQGQSQRVYVRSDSIQNHVAGSLGTLLKDPTTAISATSAATRGKAINGSSTMTGIVR